TPAEPSAILLISCPDQRGPVATVTALLYRNGGNVLHLDQHVDAQENVFFMRVEWSLNGFAIPRAAIHAAVGEIGRALPLTWSPHCSDVVPRMALFVSQYGHCLYDVLGRVQSGEWKVDIPVIVSNHPTFERVAAMFGIDFQLFRMTKENKAEQEA